MERLTGSHRLPITGRTVPDRHRCIPSNSATEGYFGWGVGPMRYFDVVVSTNQVSLSRNSLLKGYFLLLAERVIRRLNALAKVYRVCLSIWFSKRIRIQQSLNERKLINNSKNSPEYRFLISRSSNP